MTIAFTLSREQLARQVLGKLQVIAAGETPSSEDLTLVYQAIDMRMKEMHRLGVYWRNVTTTPVSFSVSAGINSASAASDILMPLVMTFCDGPRDVKMEIIDPVQYARIEDKTKTGRPEKAVWDKANSFTFWPVPLENGTVKLLYEKVADDTAANTTPDVDVSMLRWLRDIIAYDLADHYGKPENTIIRFKAECDIAERNIRKLNVQPVDNVRVAVDDFRDTPPRRSTDYNREWW